MNPTKTSTSISTLKSTPKSTSKPRSSSTSKSKTLGLAELQTQLQDHLLTGKKTILASVVETAKVTRQTRLRIYRNAYQLRLIEALSSNFPVLHAYLGDKSFYKTAKAFIAEEPSTFSSVRWFGNTFAHFLSEQVAASELYLAELADFEWQMNYVFDAADAPSFSLEEMARIPLEAWVSMKMELHPSVVCMQLQWNVNELWEAIINDVPLPEMTKNSTSQDLVMWRHDYDNYFTLLAKDEAWTLEAMSNGLNFGEICEGLCQWHAEEEVGMRAACFLKERIHQGLIRGITLC